MDWKSSASAWLQPFLPIVLLVIVATLYLRYAPDSMKPWSNQPTPPASQAAEPKVVTKIERVLVPGPTRVEVIEKVRYVEKVPESLSPATAANPEARVIASAEIPPYSGKTIATAILETGVDNVGRGRIETKQLRPPFFAVQKEFGVRGGVGTGGLVLGELYAHPVRVGPIQVEVRAFGKRDDRSGADFGAAILGDWRF